MYSSDCCLILLVRLRGGEKRVGGFDLMWNDGPVANDDELWDMATPHLYPTNTFLGEGDLQSQHI